MRLCFIRFCDNIMQWTSANAMIVHSMCWLYVGHAVFVIRETMLLHGTLRRCMLLVHLCSTSCWTYPLLFLAWVAVAISDSTSMPLATGLLQQPTVDHVGQRQGEGGPSGGVACHSGPSGAESACLRQMVRSHSAIGEGNSRGRSRVGSATCSALVGR